MITNSPILPLLQAQGSPELAENPTRHQCQKQQAREEPGAGWHLAGVRVEGAAAARMQEINGQHHHNYQLTLHTEREEEELCLALEGRGEIGRVTLL